tara:strand:- start:446 stop:1174 length:729 start_codon:yes stop_codon:yes gene_type:complete
MTSEIPFTIAFIAGVFSFLSPCVLPIVPGFMSYIIGQSYSDLLISNKQNKIKIFYSIILFISGFSLIFIIMGASIDFLSDIFFEFKKQLNFISGILIIFLGLFFIGLIKINTLNYEKKINFEKWHGNAFFPFFIGIAFAFGWSPCIGPILGSILSIAINDNVDGTILLFFYSLGLAIPFLLVGMVMSSAVKYLSNINKFMGYFQFFTGSILIITGVLIINGSIQSLGFKLNNILPSFEMLLI